MTVQPAAPEPQTPQGKQPRNPVSGKVYSATLTGTLVSVITYALTTYIPAFQNGIPTQLQPLIPVLAGIIATFIGGYSATHNVSPQELEKAIKDIDDMYEIIHPMLPIAGEVHTFPPAAPEQPAQ